MSQYYNSKRTSNLFDPKAKAPFKLSRSKIDLFMKCPRCFYLDRRLGVSQPPGFPFNLNSAVDTLLKKEFDIHRAKGESHPLMKAYKLDLIPFAHEMLDEWRENFKGVQFLHEASNFIITGAVDDLWTDANEPTELESGQSPLMLPGLGIEKKTEKSKRKIYVVDYKSTSKAGEIKALDQEWQDGYKRQMEIYQWLLRQNGFEVSDTGYFVYCNGKTDREAFDGKLDFDINLIAYNGKDDWIEEVLIEAKACLVSNKLPNSAADCDYCNYRKSAAEVEA